MRNSHKVWLLLLFLTLAFFIGGYQLGDREGLLWGAIIVFGLDVFLYLYGDLKLLRRFNCHLLEGQDAWGVTATAEKLAKKARMPVPRVYATPLDQPTSFSIGRNWYRGAIILSEELLNKWSKEEVEAVMAYEMMNIRQVNTLAYTISSALAATFLFIPLNLDRLFTRGKKKESSGRYWQPCTSVVAPLAALFVRWCVSRKSYFASDEKAVTLLGNPKALAEVLWKLDSYSQTRPLSVPATTSFMFIVNPLPQRGWNRYFHCHPPVEQRIRQIVGYFPL